MGEESINEDVQAVGSPDSLEYFRRQQSTLALLNLGVLACLMLVHVGFISLLGLPSRRLLIALTVRFLLLIAELLWLQNLKDPLTPASELVYSHLSIWVNVAFAFLASYFGGAADSHYSVLMVLPIIAAASRFHLPGTLAVASVTICLTFLEVWLFFRSHPPVDISEYFEAATVSLIFLVVALIVWSLVGHLRREQVKLEESLVELSRTRDRLVVEEKLAAIGRLSSAIAHEIRNPVAMISSSLAVAARQRPDAAVREEMFGVAAQEAARLEKLTTDFLSYARAKPPDRKLTKLAQTFGYVAGLCKARAEEAGIQIVLKVPPRLVANLDDFQIQQALLNLMMNALDATPSAGRVVLGAEVSAEKELNIFVENTGPRVSDEAISRIFEPFFTTKRSGTGLGLAIVRNIARTHGGEASLTVNEPGRVRFNIRLPGAASSLPANGNGGTDGTHSHS